MLGAGASIGFILSILFPLLPCGLNFLVPCWFSLYMFAISFIHHLILYLERSGIEIHINNYAHALIYSALHKFAFRCMLP